ncbi:hypothetical protein [Clostridium sp.]
MIYEKSNLKVVSDFEVRQIQKDEYNIDLIIPIDFSCLNLYLYNVPKYIVSRVQFPSVKSILIRFCTIEDNNICTVHFLKDSGVHSTMANFEIDYSETCIEVIAREFSVDCNMNSRPKI